MKTSTAILIFSRTAKAEAGYKTIAGAQAHNIAAHKYLLNKTITTVGETGIPYFHLTEKEQQGATFEERLLNSFSYVFQKGYENVICIGSDCPQLTATILSESKTSAENGVTCFGADKSGGVYLIAISQAQFCAGILHNINWNTSKVFIQCKNNADKIGFKFKALPLCKDINDIRCLLNYIKSAEINNAIKWVLLTLLGLIKQLSHFGLPKKQKIEFVNATVLRGPPTYLHLR